MSGDAKLQYELNQFYARYVALLDAGNFDDWLGLFAEDCSYTLIPRENYDAGRGLATMALESRAMLEDRIYGVRQTMFHAPYYQRHIIGPLLCGEAGGGISVEANYLVIRTKRDEPSEVFNAGRYIDTLARRDGVLRLTRKICVFDSELIPNSIIYPV